MILALNANPIEDLAKYDRIVYFIVASDDKKSMLRTIKLMTAFSVGAKVVTLRWLEDCYKARSFLPSDTYLPTSNAAEKKHGFSVKQTMANAKLARQLGGI